MTARTTIRKVGLPPKWRVSVDAAVIAKVDTYGEAQAAAEDYWVSEDGNEHFTGQACITSRDSERREYGWHKVKGGWLCNDARDPKFPNIS